VAVIALNLGSGQRPFKTPFINIDCQERWKPDILHDCSSLPRFEDGSVSLIVLHQVLEHFQAGEGGKLLEECKRLLVTGGSLLVFVPDIRELVNMWLEGRLTDETFLISIYGAFMGDPADTHKFGFTKATLFKELRSHGFIVRNFDWREIPGADLARDRWVLSAEAIK
jgi:predicted SAM-dependent methyltransferase